MTDTNALSVIKGFEGYIDHAKWDKNAYRAGYGSDTTTLADGSVVKINADSVVNRADSERDLARRAVEFEKTASGQIGDAWNSLPENAKAGLTSMTYNYGSLPSSVVTAAQTGDINAIAQAVRAREGDNEGINHGRRNKEADIILGSATVAPSTQYMASTEVPLHPAQAVADTPRVDAPEGPSLWQTEKDAFWQNSTLGLILNSNPYKADPSWVKPDENKLATDLEAANLDPERYAKFLGGSTSAAGYHKAIQDAQADRDRLGRLAQAGLTGTILDFVNQTLDPVNVATDIAVSAVAPELTLGKYGVRVGRVMKAALAGGASGLATSGINYAFNPNGTKADLMMGMVVGAGLGGVVGRLSGNPATASEARGLQQIGHQVLAEHEGVPYVPRGNRSVGAAQVSTGSSLVDPDSALAMVEHSDTARSAFASLRGDLAAMGDKSKNPAVRMLMGGLVQDGTGKIGASINGRAVSEDAAMLRQEFDGFFYRTWKPQKEAFLAKGGTEQQFDQQVFKYVEDTSLNKGAAYEPEVKKAGDMWAALRREQLKLQQNALEREGGVARPVQGAEKTKANENYMVHEWNNYLVHMTDEHFEEGTVLNVIKGGMRKANPDISDDDLDLVGRSFLKSIKERGAGVDDGDILARLSSGTMAEAMDALVQTGSLEKAAAENFLKNYEANAKSFKSDSGNAKPFKHRALIDTNYVLPYRPRVRATGLEHDAELGVKDLLNTNIEYLNAKYSKRAAGNIAFARLKLATKDITDESGEVISEGVKVLDGITSNAEWSDFLDKTGRVGAAHGQTPAEIAADRERLQYARDYIMGTKTYAFNNTKAGYFLRQVRKFNFIRMMNQVGLAQLPELGNLVGSVGLKAMTQQLPNLRRVIEADGVSHLKNNFGDDVEAIFGHGLEGWTRTPDERYDAMLDMIQGTKGGTWAQKASALLDKGSRFTAKASGMEGIDTLSKRWAYKAVIQKFANAAAGRAEFSEKRLADLGLSQEMFGRIKVALQDPAGVQMNGARVAGLKLDQWADKEAAEAFRRAVYRKSSEIIQKNDLGNMIKWMGHPVAQTLTQFRTFMAASYVKQTMKALHMRDPEAVINAAVATFIGAMVYEVQTREQAVGRSDADKFLKERLSWDKIASAGFAKAGVSSIIPMLVDTSLPVIGYKPEFSYSRTTGQTSGLWTGNPTLSLLDDLPKAIGATRGLLHGDLSQEEARAVWKLVPFNNAFGFMQAFNWGISRLRERAPRSRTQLVGLFGG